MAHAVAAYLCLQYSVSKTVKMSWRVVYDINVWSVKLIMRSFAVQKRNNGKIGETRFNTTESRVDLKIKILGDCCCRPIGKISKEETLA